MEFKYENEWIFYLLDWLEMEYPQGQLICVNVMNGFSAVRGMTGSGFGAYIRGEGVSHPTILIVGEAPPEYVETKEAREFFCKVFLHEFRHHLQYEEFPANVTEDWAEDDANEFAEEQYLRFVEWIGW